MSFCPNIMGLTQSPSSDSHIGFLLHPFPLVLGGAELYLVLVGTLAGNLGVTEKAV